MTISINTIADIMNIIELVAFVAIAINVFNIKKIMINNLNFEDSGIFLIFLNFMILFPFLKNGCYQEPFTPVILW